MNHTRQKEECPNKFSLLILEDLVVSDMDTIILQ